MPLDPSDALSNQAFRVNGRFRLQRMTGVERYASEICQRLQTSTLEISPRKKLSPIGGHLWEQTVLPYECRRKLLWSPCNTGPLLKSGHIVTIHDLIVLEHPEWFNPRFSALYGFLIPNLVRRASHIITVSNYTKERLLCRFPLKPDSITVIHNGVGPGFCCRPAQEVEETLQHYDLRGVPYVLTVGSLEPRKNLKTVLGAWPEVIRKHPEAMLVVVGASASRVFKSGTELVNADRVKTLGYVPESLLPSLYTGASCFVYPSLYEGFGLPVLEALACGTRTITSFNTSIPEISGPNTRMIDPLSEHELASSINEALCTRSFEESRRGEIHAKQFSWDISADLTKKVLLSYC